MKKKSMGVITGVTIAAVLITSAGTAYAMDLNDAMNGYDAAQRSLQSEVKAFDSSKSKYETAIKTKTTDVTGVGKLALSSMKTMYDDAKSTINQANESASKDDKTINNADLVYRGDAVDWKVPVWSIHDRTAQLNKTVDQLKTSVTVLNKGMDTINHDIEIKKLNAAKSELDKQLSEAVKLYDDTDGKVADDDTRAKLKTWIDATRALLKDGTKNTTAIKYKDQSGNHVKVMDAVRGSHDDWEKAEADRNAVTAVYQDNGYDAASNTQAPQTYYGGGSNSTVNDYRGNAAPQAPAPRSNGRSASSCTASYSYDCQDAVDGGGLVDVNYNNGATHVYAQHNATGGGWINELRPGQTVTINGRNFTVNDYNDGHALYAPDSGYYAQTCDSQNNRHLVGLTPQ